jgi:hypothetical protein
VFGRRVIGHDKINNMFYKAGFFLEELTFAKRTCETLLICHVGVICKKKKTIGYYALLDLPCLIADLFVSYMC